MRNIQVKVSRADAPKTIYHISGLTDQQIVEYFLVKEELCALRREVHKLRWQYRKIRKSLK